ncbi:uncharacterized protein DS421_18g629040 [Arachis hypogaea]|nr:uncharacterized protein DS421_18g629040 [Arachis hypogaea]
MAKTSVMHAIILLMIGVLICIGSAKFHENIPMKSWATPSYYIIAGGRGRTALGKCTKYCRDEYAEDLRKTKECIKKCVVLECEERHGNDPRKKKECINKLYARFTQIIKK